MHLLEARQVLPEEALECFSSKRFYDPEALLIFSAKHCQKHYRF